AFRACVTIKPVEKAKKRIKTLPKQRHLLKDPKLKQNKRALSDWQKSKTPKQGRSVPQKRA
ncbi:hypothetical protein, partial [Desulfocucumis palustris]|uniref:hypothetical protein n=1 Tax=Desulfocucumis palustris TaxID=1898651 RepID=UPI001A9A426F